jgi:hypothetical protein
MDLDFNRRYDHCLETGFSLGAEQLLCLLELVVEFHKVTPMLERFSKVEAGI